MTAVALMSSGGTVASDVYRSSQFSGDGDECTAAHFSSCRVSGLYEVMSFSQDPRRVSVNLRCRPCPDSHNITPL